MRNELTVVIIVGVVCGPRCATKESGANQDATRVSETAGGNTGILVEPPEGYPVEAPFVPGGQTCTSPPASGQLLAA